MTPLNSKRWTYFSIVILLIGAGWVWVSRASPGETTGGSIPLPQKGFSAPGFGLQTLDGQTISSEQMMGSPYVLNLWASWCPPCRAEMPALERVYQEYQDQGFVVLAVNTSFQDNLDDAQALVEQHGLSFPILLDTDGSVSQNYQLRALPTSFFVDHNGTIQEIVIGGPMSEALLRIRVEQLLQSGSE